MLSALWLIIDKPNDYGFVVIDFQQLNIPLSAKKCVGPTYELEYLGVILDTVWMQCSLPIDKVVCITEFIMKMFKKKSCPRKELEQLLGHLNFVEKSSHFTRQIFCHILV